MTIWTWVFVLLLAGLVGYLSVGVYAALTLTRVGDHPQYDNDPGTFGLAFETVTFPARIDGLQIAAWFIPNPEGEKALVMVHGRDASKQNAISGKFPELAAGIHRMGFAVLMIDLRGHGESEGERYTFGVHERWDLLGAVDFLAERGYPPEQIGLLGVSLGGAAVVGAADKEAGLGPLILDSTFADLPALVGANWQKESGLPVFFLPGVYLMWRLLYGFDLQEVKPVDALKRMPARKVLILHSRDDQTVEVGQAYQLKKAATAAELVLFDGCEHAEIYRDEPGRYWEVVSELLNRLQYEDGYQRKNKL